MKKIILMALLVIFVLRSFNFIENSTAADADTIFVDDDFNETTQGWGVDRFSNILDALNATEVGDIVFVYNGTYYEHINLEKSIVLVGEDKNNTIIDGEGFGNTVSVVADNVSISEFTIRNSGVESNNSGLMVLSDDNIIYENIVTNNSVGIILHRCGSNIIRNNFVEKNVYGIGLHHCIEKNFIFKNDVYVNNVTGIYLSFSSNISVYNNSVKNNCYGVSISYSEDNDIFDNIIDDNMHDGFNLFFCNKTVFVRNMISGSEYGISSSASNNNRVGENYIFNNSLCGIRLIIGSCENEVYGNIITSCDTGVYISIDSFNNHLYGNLFSSNNQKLVDESINVDNYSSPGFELIVLLVALTLLFLRRKSD